MKIFWVTKRNVRDVIIEEEKVPELVDLIGGKIPSNFSMDKVTGRFMSQDKKNRNSFPFIFASLLPLPLLALIRYIWFLI